MSTAQNFTMSLDRNCTATVQRHARGIYIVTCSRPKSEQTSPACKAYALYDAYQEQYTITRIHSRRWTVTSGQYKDVSGSTLRHLLVVLTDLFTRRVMPDPARWHVQSVYYNQNSGHYDTYSGVYKNGVTEWRFYIARAPYEEKWIGRISNGTNGSYNTVSLDTWWIALDVLKYHADHHTQQAIKIPRQGYWR